jgi:hypothetical protein
VNGTMRRDTPNMYIPDLTKLTDVPLHRLSASLEYAVLTRSRYVQSVSYGTTERVSDNSKYIPQRAQIGLRRARKLGRQSCAPSQHKHRCNGMREDISIDLKVTLFSLPS